MIVKKLYEGVCDFPIRGAKFVVEDNIGDPLPIHVHLGDVRGVYNNGPMRPGEGKAPFHGSLPNIRLHFTYEEFTELVTKMKQAGRL